jgi:hypothetical protein
MSCYLNNGDEEIDENFQKCLNCPNRLWYHGIFLVCKIDGVVKVKLGTVQTEEWCPFENELKTFNPKDELYYVQDKDYIYNIIFKPKGTVADVISKYVNDYEHGKRYKNPTGLQEAQEFCKKLTKQVRDQQWENHFIESFERTEKMKE